MLSTTNDSAWTPINDNGRIVAHSTAILQH
jgi:hypothetical protein